MHGFPPNLDTVADIFEHSGASGDLFQKVSCMLQREEKGHRHRDTHLPIQDSVKSRSPLHRTRPKTEQSHYASSRFHFPKPISFVGSKTNKKCQLVFLAQIDTRLKLLKLRTFSVEGSEGTTHPPIDTTKWISSSVVSERWSGALLRRVIRVSACARRN